MIFLRKSKVESVCVDCCVWDPHFFLNLLSFTNWLIWRGELWIRASIFSGASCYCVLWSAFILQSRRGTINRVKKLARGSAEGAHLLKDTKQLPPASESPWSCVRVCGGREGCELYLCLCFCVHILLSVTVMWYAFTCVFNNNAAGFCTWIYPQGSIKYFCLSVLSMEYILDVVFDRAWRCCSICTHKKKQSFWFTCFYCLLQVFAKKKWK